MAGSIYLYRCLKIVAGGGAAPIPWTRRLRPIKHVTRREAVARNRAALMLLRPLRTRGRPCMYVDLPWEIRMEPARLWFLHGRDIAPRVLHALPHTRGWLRQTSRPSTSFSFWNIAGGG